MAVVVALGAMVVDHLIGTDRDGETGLADPAMFAISAVLSLTAAALLFGWLVPRERRAGAERSAIVGLLCSALSVVPGMAFAWLGFPFVLAGAGMDLGLNARHGGRRRLALAAVVIGSTFMAFGAAVFTYAAIDGLL